MTAYACIATRHEAETIAPLVTALLALGLRVIVEDESDTPHTYMAAASAGASAHWTPGPQRTGLGPSLMRAWRRALQEGATAIVQLDAGGSHRAEDAARLLNALPRWDMIVGSRFYPGGVYIGNPRRAFLSKLAAELCNRRARHSYGAGLHGRLNDWTSGLRAFTSGTARSLLDCEYRYTGHAWQIEVIDRALMAGAYISEFPITYTAGRSSLNWRGAWEAYQAWRMI